MRENWLELFEVRRPPSQTAPRRFLITAQMSIRNNAVRLFALPRLDRAFPWSPLRLLKLWGRRVAVEARECLGLILFRAGPEKCSLSTRKGKQSSVPGHCQHYQFHASGKRGLVATTIMKSGKRKGGCELNC